MLVSGALHHQTTPPITTNNTNTVASQGLKRKTDDDLASEQRLAKRFHLLNLGKGKNQITAEDIQKVHAQLEKNGHDDPQYIMPEGPRLRRSRSNAFSDTMNVDSSRDRVFIHNLEDELADLSSDEEHPIFIPDIERKLNMLPKSLLRPDHPPKQGNELVLYEVPSSLSIPIERDSIRKAILESRHRAQEQALLSNTGHISITPRGTAEYPSISNDMGDIGDDDAMDVS